LNATSSSTSPFDITLVTDTAIKAKNPTKWKEFLHRERKDLPPLITVQTLTLRSGYSGLLRIHKLVNDVHGAGLHERLEELNVLSTGVQVGYMVMLHSLDRRLN
jgi:hypothetical protein